MLIGLSVGVNNSSSSVRLVAAFSCTAWNGSMTTYIVVVDQPPPGGRKISQWTNLVDKTVSGQTNEIAHRKDVIIEPTLLGGSLETWLRS